MNFRLLFSFLGFSIYFSAHSLVLAEEACQTDQHAAITKLAATATACAKLTDCERLQKAKTKDELKKALYEMSLQQNEILKPAPKNRHEVGQRLNDCYPEKDSKALVLSFAGTGSYEPRGHHLMTKSLACFAGNKLNPSLEKIYYSSVLEALRMKGKKPKWSAIDAGLMPLFLTDEKLSNNAKKFDFAVFPSEESEAIADPEKIDMTTIKNLPYEMQKSNAGLPTGIKNAMSCAVHYLRRAKELGIKPKIIVLTHSSGGRSAVKFHENMKKIVNPLTGKHDFKSDLVFTIDPVIEAHEAMKEVAEQYAGEAGHKINEVITQRDLPERPPVNVWSRDHKDRLYKTSNSKKWVSVFQTSDKDGIKGPVKFGIQGSKISGADKNLYITDGLSHDAHGAIGYHDKTRELFLESMDGIIQ